MLSSLSFLASGASALHLPTAGAPHIRSAQPTMPNVAMSAKTADDAAITQRRLELELKRLALEEEKVELMRSMQTEDLAPMTQTDVFECQKNWAAAIVACSKIHAEGGDYIAAAAGAAEELYGYGFLPEVLFKPTKALDVRFRPTAGDAMSYFVGGDVVDNGYDEDGGFAINNGNGWERVVFNNHAISLNKEIAIAMGFYDFTDAKSKQTVTVEYTFGYKRCADGKPRIFLHHSSVPFQKTMTGESLLLAPLTESDVLVCQGKWANAITSISKTYFDKGDVVGQGMEAAKELYGYGFGDVLFKPSKTGDVVFRPTFDEAMSYFVGAKNVEEGYEEDAGFWYNGGNGWAKVEFTNHKIEVLGSTALAMGTKTMLDATTMEESTIEYTFGYKRCSDGKVRIFLQHASVPFSGGGNENRDQWLARAKKVEGVVTSTAVANKTVAAAKK